VKRINDINKKNRVKVVLTDKGREIYKKASKIDSIRTVMSVLSEEECEQMKSFLNRLRNKAKAYQYDIEF
jgi:DNA-binding MarR family transcriptional regulator